MKKRGKWLTAMGLAMLLTLQTPVAAVVEASTDGGIQQEMTVENQKGTKEDRDESEVQSEEEQSEKQSDLEIQKNDIIDEERTEVIPQEASQMSESVKKEQIIYTWKYDAEIGWQLWKSEGEEEEKICAPGVYILKDGIYYLGVYETEDKEVSRIKEEEPEQGVLKEGMVSVTDTTPVITDEEKEIILQEGTYYFSYETGGEEESQQPRDGKYLTNTWVHPGEDVSVWYYVNKEGVQEDPALHEGPMQNETGYFYLDKQGKSQSGKFKINGVIYNYDGKGNRSQIRDGWQQDGNNWYYIENGQQATGWKNLQSNWYYLNPQNGILQKGVFRDYTGTLYYADSNGRMISGNGWKQIGTAWYWLQAGGALTTGWINTGGNWYYLDPNTGAMHTGWYQVNGSWYYSDGSGMMQSGGWINLGGTWYYLGGSGAMYTGWLNLGGKWYYLDPGSGAMRTGWYRDVATWYYSDGSGAMVSGGWLNQGGTWYYLSGSGAMYTGWLNLGGKWYYLDPGSGAMRTGWYRDGATWYYSNGSGAMQSGGWINLGGTWYYLSGSGAMYTGWLNQGGSWYYLDGNSGAMHTGWYQVNGSWYYSDGSGKVEAGRWMNQGETWYYLSGSGAAFTGWQKIGNTWYYFYDDCRMAANTWINNYYVNSDGAWSDTATVMPGATYNYAFPTAQTKKGLQVKDGMEDDASNLGVKHAVVNIALNHVASGSGIEYQYQGKTYYMNTGYIHELDRQIKELHNRGMVLTAVIVLQWNYQQQDLILPGARSYGYNLYGWNTQEATGKQHLEAICSFLANRYATPDMGVVNWICGNEVNAWKDYHYSGSVGFDQYMEYYAQAYQLLYNCVKHAYSNGRIYMSIDHTWTYNRRANCYTSKSVLDRFAQLMNQKGISDWMIAFHPYPAPELQSDFWNRTLDVIDSENSPIITMANLSYFTEYVKKNYGAGKRIILSECGFTSVTNGNDRQDIQAAAIAYGYYLAEANDMVDSFVVHRQVDHSAETQQGFHLGLWTCKPGSTETADSKKQAYDVFKYMDTKQYMTYTKFALPLIKKNSWEQAVSGFNPAKFT